MFHKLAAHPIPVYFKKHLHQMQDRNELVSLDYYLAFHKLLDHADSVELAIELYTAGKFCEISFSGCNVFSRGIGHS